ncbi:PREDICTED: disintegrin and metalloproteinase domain-containing protein 10-like [Priapulus caudatus]|uniref:Disintegrin and metalloproteinase domain-containing protein 10-like n=1 Tax=Priapulus caudatus TaxID=37621 RepID=A0ABM1EAB1_PRICU|nr:PREDICTED: disintegrin and metalloproteinase domain-containing protein 10-like [Priapulus caudatus]
MLGKEFIVTLVIYFFYFVESANRLNEYISNYDVVRYDREELHRHHLRTKRGAADYQPFLHLDFHALGRHFHVRLRRDTSIFSEDFVLENHEGPLEDFDTSFFYVGDLWGVEGTKVDGSILKGVFDGKIYTPKGNYYIERAQKYLDDPVHPSIIYAERDVDDVYRHKRETEAPGCGLTSQVEEWMHQIQTSATDEGATDAAEGSAQDELAAKRESLSKVKTNFGLVENKYSEEAQSDGYSNTHETQAGTGRRVKRERPATNTCSLFIQTDTLFWDWVGKRENHDKERTRDEILSLIGGHVKAVNRVYEETRLGSYTGLRFVVQRTKIQLALLACHVLRINRDSAHLKKCHQALCKWYLIVRGARADAVLVIVARIVRGSANVTKSTRRRSNGRRPHVQEPNTGIVTFVRLQQPAAGEGLTVSPIGTRIGTATLASPHDYPLHCRPGGPEGNYLMYASATGGDRYNNDKFSECSVGNVSQVLDAVLNEKNGKNNCFSSDEGAFCGNNLVEEGEECDCGYEDECREDCCYPRTTHGKVQEGTPCTLKAHARCSPSQGPCCGHNCEYLPESRGYECQRASECHDVSFCNGLTAHCPTPDPKQNRTACNKNTQVCWGGECRGSICNIEDMEQCSLTTDDNHKDRSKLCHVACQLKDKPETCTSSFEISQLMMLNNNTGISLQPGAPCNEFQGYCDVFLKCREVDADGPLARLKNLIFNQDTFNKIATWITDFWWAVVLMVIGLICFMALFIKCCAVHTPSSNPKQPPAKKFSDTLSHTLRRRPRQVHGQPTVHASAPPVEVRGSAPPGSSRQGGGQSRGRGGADSEGKRNDGRSRGGNSRGGGEGGGGRGQPSGSSSSANVAKQTAGGGSEAVELPPPYEQVVSPAQQGPHRGYGKGRGPFMKSNNIEMNPRV